MFSYRNLCLALVSLTATLFAVLLIAPQWISLLFGIQGDDASAFISRRAAMLFLGYTAIAATARDAEASPARRAFLLGVAVSMGGLAVLGAAEFARGYAGPGILLAVAGESAFAAWALVCRRSA